MSADKPTPMDEYEAVVADLKRRACSPAVSAAVAKLRDSEERLAKLRKVFREAGVTVEPWHVSVGYERAPTRWERFKAWVARVWS